MNIEMTPSPVLMETLKNIGYTIETSLADIIDNSITAEAKKISVRFSWNNGDPWVAVIDDGYGMNPDTLKQSMQFSRNSPSAERAIHDLGRYGLGMKTASIAHCQKLVVCSQEAGAPLGACVWDLDKITKSGHSGWTLEVMNQQEILDTPILSSLVREYIDKPGHGTIVLWRNMLSVLQGTRQTDMERKFNEIMNSARKHLEVVFHRFLSSGTPGESISIDFNKMELSAFNPFGKEHLARTKLPLEVVDIPKETPDSNGKREILGTINIQAYILPHRNKVSAEEYELNGGEEGYLHNQGLYIYRNKRLIVRSSWLRLRKKEELLKLVRIKVDFPNSLDHLWSINIDKSQVTIPEIVRERIKQILNTTVIRGKAVYNRRAANYDKVNKTFAWKRSISEGQVTYSINEDHQLVKAVLANSDPKSKAEIKALLSVIADEFPYETCHIDVANDIMPQIKNKDASVASNSHREYVHALLECDFSAEDIIETMKSTTIEGLTEEIVNQIINEFNSQQHES